ncbi:acyl--CoA ligase [soil metagenome]
MNNETESKIEEAHHLSYRDDENHFVRYRNIYDLIVSRKDKHPERLYLKFYTENGESTSYTYSEFASRVNSIADYLLTKDVKPESRIAVFSHNHSDTVILYFAAWSVGAVIVPINVSEEIIRVEYILEDSCSRLIFTRNEYIEKLKGIKHTAKVVNFNEESFSDNSADLKPDHSIGIQTECMIVYTSGTTGNPKGVVLTQYNLLTDSENIHKWHKLDEGDTMMCVLPIHHVNGTVVTIMTTMFYGGSLILNQKFQTGTFFKRLSEDNVKVVSVVPTLLQFLLHSNEDISGYDLKGFSHIICGAGPLTCELARKFERNFMLKIVHGYGLSETTCYSCFIPVDLSQQEHDQWMYEYGYPSIGIPLECNEMEIQDEKGEPLSENEKGEIVIRGHNVMKYYFNNDEVNNKTFEFGWFRSGDEGFFKTDKNGKKYFFITGRLKELIIRGGVNISTLEIDEVIANCGNVVSGIAVGFENDWYGEEVGALIMLKEGDPASEELKNKILESCSKILPFYKCPKVVVFTDEIPVTSTGKYQRNKAKHLFNEFKTIQFKK